MNPYTNDTGIALSMAVYLATDEYDHNDDKDAISVTGLMKPLKQIILGSRIPIEQQSTDISGLLSSRMGTSIHNGIESAWLNNYEKAMLALGYPRKVVEKVRINPTPDDLARWEENKIKVIPVYMEQRTDKKVGKWTVSGKYDFVAEGRLEDFKSTKVYSYINKTNDKKYILQGSIYRWLNPTIITQDIMAIQYIFTDWAAMQAKTNSNYPTKAALEVKFNLLSIGETEQYIRTKLAQIEKYFDADEADIPECNDEDLWRRDPVWKYYKNPTKMTRSTKNYDNEMDASMRLHQDGNVGTVVEVKGEVVACRYCAALNICQQKNNYILNGTLNV